MAFTLSVVSYGLNFNFWLNLSKKISERRYPLTYVKHFLNPQIHIKRSKRTSLQNTSQNKINKQLKESLKKKHLPGKSSSRIWWRINGFVNLESNASFLVNPFMEEMPSNAIRQLVFVIEKSRSKRPIVNTIFKRRKR